jgi:hypothetical protein
VTPSAVRAVLDVCLLRPHQIGSFIWALTGNSSSRCKHLPNRCELPLSAIAYNHGRDTPDQAEWHPSPVQDFRTSIQDSSPATKHTPNCRVSRSPRTSISDSSRVPAKPKASNHPFPRPTRPRTCHGNTSAGSRPVPRSIVTSEQGITRPHSHRQHRGGGKTGAERGSPAFEAGKRRSTIESGPSVELGDRWFTSSPILAAMDLCCRHARAQLGGRALDYGWRGHG